jgi:hypothetical protein
MAPVDGQKDQRTRLCEAMIETAAGRACLRGDDRVAFSAAVFEELQRNGFHKEGNITAAISNVLARGK